ncbi:hypothetical protein GLOTRDRAFT_92971 [Gloeophyllum trabeum ATCC 11539]|uniref:Uncharacterized protein n=1 Tax=Gloeophyllum trabeum (strain ATCC 11539 / FP-39264 / Madison 617) TaxID=670483 RepID=S7RPR5_GLOTA|nr:uncharacterized protein GLOTRDRAFT_92971 [Gloeophyllum trabeum ATCC 11539]EPQ56555.1 hypothetical protein GLOTRDRAFT_92971 [Gloeophyllum trabeum ATCC 11539]
MHRKTKLQKKSDIVERLSLVNRLPDEAERSLLLDEVANATALLDSIKSKSRSRQEDRILVQAYADKCRSLLSPFRGLLGLPLELLHEIFLHCLPEEDRFLIPWPDRAPVALLAVCKYWRDAALSNTELWSSVHIHYLSPHRREAWLARAQTRPLALSYDSTRTDERGEQMTRSIRFLISVAHRCSVLHLSLPPDSFPQVNRMELPDLPLLTELEVRDCHLARASETFTRDQGTVSLPNLRSFKCTWLYPEQYEDLSLPWSRLTNLDVQVCSPACLTRLLNFIDECQELRRLLLRLTPNSQTFHWIAPVTSICLTNLTELGLYSWSSEFNIRTHNQLRKIFSDLVRHLNLPRLEALSIGNSATGWPDWRSLIVRSNCSLQKLSIAGMDEMAPMLEHFMPLLAICPGLQALQIVHDHQHFSLEAVKLFDCLINRASSDDPTLTLPELQVLRVLVRFEHEDGYDMFKDHVKSLLHSGSQGRSAQPIFFAEIGLESWWQAGSGRKTWTWTRRNLIEHIEEKTI